MSNNGYPFDLVNSPARAYKVNMVMRSTACDQKTAIKHLDAEDWFIEDAEHSILSAVIDSIFN